MKPKYEHLIVQIENCKDYICSAIEEKVNEKGYLGYEEIEHIIQKSLKMYLKRNPKKIKSVVNVMWWIFATPNYRILVSLNGKEDRSGIYSFSKEKVEEEFKKYFNILMERLLSL